MTITKSGQVSRWSDKSRSANEKWHLVDESENPWKVDLQKCKKSLRRVAALDDELQQWEAQLSQVREEVQKLSAIKQELRAQLKAIHGESASTKSELQEMTAIEAEIEIMHQEIQKGRWFVVKLLARFDIMLVLGFN
ncbi:hypothetical protein Nepgr_014180 [Nepenthes gracilis]|uniref:Uncharacterized protein n=1 Tax=Nepenthes gracilis TaxID=150966 RepID=A0AAD3SKG6_NEPGR|nr:hypothetical protein Nepgr_014180 [Nepenthes gracilis]